MRQTFSYAFEICGVRVEGAYRAERGHIDFLTLPDETEVEINRDGSTIDKGQGSDAMILAGLIAEKILANPVCQDELARTRPEESWAGYAPVVI